MRKCTEKDRPMLNAYLNQDPAMNLFFIGDIANFGFDTDFQHIFAEEDQSGFQAVYLIYHRNLCLQSRDGKINEEAVAMLLRDYPITTVNGEPSLLKSSLFSAFSDINLCRLASLKSRAEETGDFAVETLGLRDVPEALHLTELCFPGTERNEDEARKKLESHAGRMYGIRENGRLVSLAQSTAECDTLAMVVGVCTAEHARGKGYASACVAKLSNDLLSERKCPCLFYSNPAAARIYQKLGYRDAGQWAVLKKPV